MLSYHTSSHRTIAANSTDIAVQEQQFNATSTDKGYAYKLQFRAEGVDQQDVNVTSSANTADGISLAKGYRLIDSRFDTKTVDVYLIGNHSAKVILFGMCGVMLDGTKLCQYYN